MKPIKIITDSLSDIPKELIEKYNINVIPLTIRFGDDEYRDREDLSSKEFFEKLQESHALPTTSQIPPIIFMKEMKKSIDEGYEVIVINGSSGVSGTYQSAMMAKREMQSEEITVIDTLALSYGCGMIVVEAAKMAKCGQFKEEIIRKIETMKENIDHLFSVEKLDFLEKGGRLSSTKATIGNILNIKPILTIEDGKVEVLDKVRGNRKIIHKLIDLAKQRGIKRGTECIGIVHGDNIEGLEKLKEAVIKEFAPQQIVETESGCTIGTYTGPTFLAMLYVKDEK